MEGSLISLWGVVAFLPLIGTAAYAGEEITKKVTLAPRGSTVARYGSLSSTVIEVNCHFQAPAVDSTKFTIVSVSGNLFVAAGGAVWGTGRQDEEMEAATLKNADMNGKPVWDHVSRLLWSHTYSHVSFSKLEPLDVSSVLEPYKHYTNYPGGENGTREIPFHMLSYSEGRLAYVPPPYFPSRLSWVRIDRLELTYVLQPMVPTLPQELPTDDLGPHAEVSAYANESMDGKFEIPDVVSAEFPESISSKLSVALKPAGENGADHIEFSGTLQESSNLKDWIDVSPQPTSPYIVDAPSGQRFFRSRTE